MWRYTISGAGPFPTGLLCLARAWPAELEDADAMILYRGVNRKLVRRITLLSPIAPERDLWRDAGWEVQSCKWEP